METVQDPWTDLRMVSEVYHPLPDAVAFLLTINRSRSNKINKLKWILTPFQRDAKCLTLGVMVMKKGRYRQTCSDGAALNWRFLYR